MSTCNCYIFTGNCYIFWATCTGFRPFKGLLYNLWCFFYYKLWIYSIYIKIYLLKFPETIKFYFRTVHDSVTMVLARVPRPALRTRHTRVLTLCISLYIHMYKPKYTWHGVTRSRHFIFFIFLLTTGSAWHGFCIFIKMAYYLTSSYSI